jgi:hypothetical protein
MISISIERKALTPLLAVVSAFITSRILYDQAGIHFLGDTYLRYWQFIDTHLLQKDLWRSIFYLHSQPPLMNLITGMVLQGFPETHAKVFHLLYYISGLILAVSIYGLGLCMRLPAWLSATFAVFFVISPATVIYEHWLMYAHPLATILTLAGMALYQFADSGRSFWGIIFFFLLAIMALTWSLFHITWFLGTMLILLPFMAARKKMILAALIPTLLVTGWYAKNLWYVGEFTSSTWLGMNLSKIITFRTPEKERKLLVRSGQLSEFALIPPFRNPTVYLELLADTPATGIPILDEAQTTVGSRNHHHLVYVKASEHYLRDALYLALLWPRYYARSLLQAVYIYFHSGSDFDLTTANRDQILTLDTWWNRLFYGQWQSNETSIDRNIHISAVHVGWWIVVSFLSTIIGSARFLWRQRGQPVTPRTLLVVFMMFNILFLSIAGNTLDIGENNRFRFVIDPFLMVLFTFVLHHTFFEATQDPAE